MVDIIRQAYRSAYILDMVCNDSPISPLLRRLGFKSLYGCGLLIKKIPYINESSLFLL